MFDDTKMTIIEMAARGYSCGQIVMLMGLRLLGRENPELIRSMGGLAMGAGFGNLCGALTGGLCLISLHTAKGLDDERAIPGGRTILGALVKWFRDEELGGLEPYCRTIFENSGQNLDPLNGQPAIGCADLVAHTWSKAVSLLTEFEIDPTRSRDEEF